MFVSALVLLDECWLPKRSRFSKYFFIKCVRFNLGSQRFILENDIGIPRGGGAKIRKCWIWILNLQMLHINLRVNMSIVSLVELMHGGRCCNLSASAEATHRGPGARHTKA